MKVVRLSALRTGRLYPPGKIPDTHFCWRLSRPQGHSATETIMSMKNSKPALRPIQAPITWVPRALSAGVKWPECDVGHSFASSAEVTNEGTYTSTPPVCLHNIHRYGFRDNETKQRPRIHFLTRFGRGYGPVVRQTTDFSLY
jgi:hypothetical protein